jgi:hypothetical protein
MKPTMKAAARATAPDADPWRLGVRYRRVVGPDGEEHVEELPLRPEDLLYPEEGDQPVYTRGHSRDCTYLEVVFDDRCESRPGMLTLREHVVDFGVPGLKPLGPDVIVLDGVRDWDNSRGTFRVVGMLAKTLLVVEVTSPDTRDNDLELKPALYHRCKVPLYVIVDRQAGESGKEVCVLGFRRTRTRYAPLAPDEHGRVWLEPVGLWLGVEGDRAVCYDERGERIAPPNERVRVAEVAALAARRAEKKAKREKAQMQKRIEELEAQIRQSRGER